MTIDDNLYFSVLKENEELKKYKNLFFKMKKFHFDERINNDKILKENEDLKDSIKRFTCQSECLRYKQYQQAKETLIKIKEKWQEFKKLSHLQIDFNSKIVYELNKIIEQ